jgi:hypothetical protein
MGRIVLTSITMRRRNRFAMLNPSWVAMTPAIAAVVASIRSVMEHPELVAQIHCESKSIL